MKYLKHADAEHVYEIAEGQTTAYKRIDSGRAERASHNIVL